MVRVARRTLAERATYYDEKRGPARVSYAELRSRLPSVGGGAAVLLGTKILVTAPECRPGGVSTEAPGGCRLIGRLGRPAPAGS